MTPQKNYNSNIKDHKSQINITNIIIMKKKPGIEDLNRHFTKEDT